MKKVKRAVAQIETCNYSKLLAVQLLIAVQAVIIVQVVVLTTDNGYYSTEDDETKKTGCQPGWKQHGDKCYKVFPEEIRRFIDASGKCSDLQAHVAALETPEENDFVKNLLDQEHLPRHRDVWLSGRRQNEDSPYVWSTGAEMAYSDWSPNWSPSETSALCMDMFKNNNPKWQWGTEPCTNRGNNGVVCEKAVN